MTDFEYIIFQTNKNGNIFIKWGVDDACFGLVSIKLDGGKFKEIDSEFMEKEFVKQLFCKLIDDAEIDT